MSSAICQNFVQNAWKKELCSNCFKLKDEHTEPPKPKPLPLPTSKIKVESIIRTADCKKSKKNVIFTEELTQVIGFGGEDWYCDEPDHDDDEETGSSSSSEEECGSAGESEEEAEKELKRITKENTDFNTTGLKAEAKDPKETNGIKRAYTQLMLGKPVVDSAGRKQTLLVSVTPFGEDVSPKKLTKISHIPISKINNKDVEKPTVVLTSYTKNGEDKPAQNGHHKDENKEEKSLLDEITETLENGKNPIQILPRKKTQKDIVLSVARSEPEVKKSEVEVKLKKLTRAPALKARDIEKPVIYQTSTAKIELLNTKNLLLNKRNNNTNNHNNNNNNNTPEAVKAGVVKEIETGEMVKVSREQAGEPDGRADPPDSPTEPPALPLTPPPPLETTQCSFLHNPPTPVYDKPKILGAKPLARKPPVQVKAPPAPPPIPSSSDDEDKAKLAKQDSNGCGKRRAPKPPEDLAIYTRCMINGNGSITPTCGSPNGSLLGTLATPVPSTPSTPSGGDVTPEYISTETVTMREKEARPSSCTPKICSAIIEPPYIVPQPVPRKFLSNSTDCLLTTAAGEKRKTKGRFSLKKFLRMGSSKELQRLHLEPHSEHRITENPTPPLPKPRLVIVHPSELNGAKVEVVMAKMTNEYESIPSPKKPPPPPRNFERDWNKPNPNPPKSVDVKQKQYNTLPTPKKTETVYANIGEVRSAIVPNKPQRTASMRERESQEMQKRHNDYEPINVDGENIYNYINTNGKSSPPYKNGIRKRSESSNDVSGEYFRYSNIPKSISMTYCGSETESEIYSPYSYYGSESEITEDDHDWTGRTHKLRSRKGRSIVHKNLEDNYGAVIVANHEALAQVLENIQQTSHIQPSLRYLKSLPNLRWTDFSIKTGTEPLKVGSRVFHQALWGTQHVTLAVTSGTVTTSTLSLGTFSLTAITEFSDLIPAKYSRGGSDDKQVQATVAVLPWLQVNTLQQYSESLEMRDPEALLDDANWKDATFVMLQLVNALKTLQAQGIEELSLSLNSFLLCKEMDKDTHSRLCVLHGLGESSDGSVDELGTLCRCALKAVTILQPTGKTTPLIQSLLSNEKAVTLTQVKSILEFCLWGPSDVALGTTIPERELALQRWLDLQRATVLHGLVCTRVQLTVYEECHLLFLVRSNSRMMSDASLLLESSKHK